MRKVAIIFGVLILALGGFGYYLSIKPRPQVHPPTVKGDLIPQVELKSIDGKSFDFPKDQTSFSLVVFWASWCAPCAQETPSLAELARRNPTWQFLLISEDSTLKEIKDFLRIFPSLNQPHIHIIWDKDRSLNNTFGVSGLPESFLVDDQGRLVEKFTGSRDWTTLKID
jgi:cytochrome c biogenesis protein CcmG, thiol:disulfide interchange protein DsbE